MISQIRAFINMFGYVMLAMGVVLGIVGLTNLFSQAYLTGVLERLYSSWVDQYCVYSWLGPGFAHR